LHFNGHGNNICSGASASFTAPNFADTNNPIMVLLYGGLGKTSHSCISVPQNRELFLRDWIVQAEHEMPTLRQMHQIGAAQPRAQAKLCLLMTELHYRFLHGLERLHFGRHTLARPIGPRANHMATSVQPSLTSGAADMQAPGEGQGRGPRHAHSKGHGIVGPTMLCMRDSLRKGTDGLVAAARGLRKALLNTAALVQYGAANEPGRQLGIHDMPPEPLQKTEAPEPHEWG